MLTFAGGGWVLLLMAIICLGLVTWALAPALLRMVDRPPGDGKDPESYGFDLSNLTLDRAGLDTVLLHRDLVPVMSEPEVITAAEVARINDEERGKYLVSTDRVVGVEINGEARAYPIMLMNVHEVINDTLGGVPIAVTYSWLCDAPVVVDRRIGETVAELGVSGLIHDYNTLLYDRSAAEEMGGESLWLQMTGECVAGPALGQTLSIIPCELTGWSSWLAQHAGTSVIARPGQYVKRYKKSAPDAYFLSDEMKYVLSVAPPADGPRGKARVVAVELADGSRHVYTFEWLVEQARGGQATDSIGEVTLHFDVNRASGTVQVTAEPAQSIVRVVHALWFTYHARWPEVARVVK